jgi:hypothetical protein
VEYDSIAPGDENAATGPHSAHGIRSKREKQSIGTGPPSRWPTEHGSPQCAKDGSYDQKKKADPREGAQLNRRHAAHPVSYRREGIRLSYRDGIGQPLFGPLAFRIYNQKFQDKSRESISVRIDRTKRRASTIMLVKVRPPAPIGLLTQLVGF